MNCMTKTANSGATGIVKRCLENVEAIPEKRSIDALQRAAVSPSICKVLQPEN